MAVVIETILSLPIPPVIAKVQSDSDPSTKHTVVISCDCKGFMYKGACKHVSRALAASRAKGRTSTVHA